MKTMLRTLLLAALTAAITGCSKNEPGEPVAKAGAVTITTPSGSISLADVDKALKEKNYDGAVQVLAQFKAQYATLEADQRAAFDQKVREAVSALIEAKATDPKAGSAYDRLGRIITGR